MGLLEKLDLTMPRVAALATAGGPGDDAGETARDAADPKEPKPPTGGPSERELNVSRRPLKPTIMSATISVGLSERTRVAVTHGRNSG